MIGRMDDWLYGVIIDKIDCGYLFLFFFFFLVLFFFFRIGIFLPFFLFLSRNDVKS